MSRDLLHPYFQGLDTHTDVQKALAGTIMVRVFKQVEKQISRPHEPLEIVREIGLTLWDGLHLDPDTVPEQLRDLDLRTKAHKALANHIWQRSVVHSLLDFADGTSVRDIRDLIVAAETFKAEHSRTGYEKRKLAEKERRHDHDKNSIRPGEKEGPGPHDQEGIRGGRT